MNRFITYWQTNSLRLGTLMLLIVVSFSSQAQLSIDEKNLLSDQILIHLNKHRIANELQEIKSDPILNKAANNQSLYLDQIKKLSHEQEVESLKTPFKRVIHFGGNDFEIIGENVLSSSTVTLPISNEELKSLAKEMYLSWKNSPPHYENMINPKYHLSGLAFKFSQENQVIYATQVFGKKGVRIPNQISDNAFEIKYSDDCDEFYARYSNIIANMGNAIYRRNNDIMFNYHNINYYYETFPNNKDGIAIDVIARNQLECGQENQLDLSPIYDGVLLPPMYKEEILTNNMAKSDYRIKSKIGTIPTHLTEQEISLSTIFLGNNATCKYTIPARVPSKDYKLKEIKPKLLKPKNIKFIYEGIIKSIHLNYNFSTGITTPEQYPEIPPIDYKIHSIEIVSFSSIEGSSKSNKILHDNRAKKINEHLNKNLDINQDNIKIISGENWERMNFQLKYYFADKLLILSKDSLKYLIETGDHSLPWDSLFYEQRQSTATLNYFGKIENIKQFVEVAKLNLRTATSTKNHKLANKTLYKMFESKSNWPEIIFEDQVFNAISTHPELVQNAAAFLTKVYKNNTQKCIRFMDKWISNHERLSEDAKYNLYILYALINYDLLDMWDLPSKRLAHVIHPSRIESSINQDLSNEVMLNLHLTFINYYGQINDGQRISKSFYYISNYFQSKILNPKDEIDLVLFYNKWSMYHLTRKLLLPKFYKNKLNEEALFILMKTINYNEEFPDLYADVYLKAFESNKNKWCNYVNENFQILRIEKIKNIFCQHCFSHNEGDL